MVHVSAEYVTIDRLLEIMHHAISTKAFGHVARTTAFDLSEILLMSKIQRDVFNKG